MVLQGVLTILSACGTVGPAVNILHPAARGSQKSRLPNSTLGTVRLFSGLRFNLITDSNFDIYTIK